MKIPAIAAVVFLFLLSVPVCGQKPLGLIGGNVFDGEKFVRKDLFIVEGRITFRQPAVPGRAIDVTGRYLIPPFGDAHTHNLDREWQLSFLPAQYLREGTFYVQNLTAKTKDIGRFKKYFSTPQTPDVIFAHQGLTGTLGHPFMAYEPYAMGLSDYRQWRENEERIRQSRIDENNSYIFIDSKREAREKLPGFFAARPDVVKIFLLDVENYPKNSTDRTPGNSGLPPGLASYIVEEAHRRGLRVYAHIDTAADFEAGVRAGVDGFAHIPTWNGDPATRKKYEVSEKVLKRAAAADIAVIPTIANVTGGNPKDSPEYKNQIEYFRDFLVRYRRLGGRVLIGSDYFNKPLTVEIRSFIETGAFDELTLLRILSETTPQAIFPERKIGVLREGFEGSVLVLEKDPLADPENLFGIIHRIKQGHVLNLADK